MTISRYTALAVLCVGGLLTVLYSAATAFNCVWWGNAGSEFTSCLVDEGINRDSAKSNALRDQERAARDAVLKPALANIDLTFKTKLETIKSSEGSYPTISRFKVTKDRSGQAWERLDVCVNSPDSPLKIGNDFKLNDTCPTWWPLDLKLSRSGESSGWNIHTYDSNTGDYAASYVQGKTTSGPWTYDETALTNNVYLPVIIPYIKTAVAEGRFGSNTCNGTVSAQAYTSILLRDIATKQYIFDVNPIVSCDAGGQKTSLQSKPIYLLIKEVSGSWIIEQTSLQ